MTEPAAAASVSAQRKTKRLTSAQVDAFARNGYHFPLRALSTDEALVYRGRLEQSEAALGGPLRGSLRSKPHLILTWANELMRHPAILDAVEDILGPNLLVWSSSFFHQGGARPELRVLASGFHLLGVGPSRCSHCLGGSVGEYRGERLHARDSRVPLKDQLPPPGHLRRDNLLTRRPGSHGRGG